PVLVGASRKSFIGRLTGEAPAGDRLEGSLSLAVWAMQRGAAMVRVHDVRATVQAARLVAA
ncbi:MAG: dihydropteroate synthase, partial [Acidimicrobiia bacterium]|nr:dihydropteroate synthase [Acidimicrobiia bacterium]